uniref:Uncharacterized protein n=1 Tax=Cynoglossus semilaevis TaxID=244447 RepID=A0A3P8WLF1_CYNSE
KYKLRNTLSVKMGFSSKIVTCQEERGEDDGRKTRQKKRGLFRRRQETSKEDTATLDPHRCGDTLILFHSFFSQQ